MNTYLLLCVIWQCAVYVHGEVYNPDIEKQRIKEHNIESVNSSTPLTSILGPASLYVKWNAVDGVKKTNIAKQGCFHSENNDNTPWLSVTYKNAFEIEGVVITNRQDCCGERLSKLTVNVDGILCATYNLVQDDDPGETLKLKCENVMRGSTVKIMRNGQDLTLCEVETMIPL